MTNEQEVVRSVFSSYINDLKAHSTKPDRPMFKMLEDVKDKAIKALEAQSCIEDYPTCTECEHYDSEKHYCPRFCQVIKDTLAEAQPTDADCISRQDAIDFIIDNYGVGFTSLTNGIRDYLPSVTPQRPKGKWLHIYKSDIACECSVCHMQMPITEYYHYCPNCGAEMSGGEEDD